MALREAAEADRPLVSVVLPCLNEAGSVALVVRLALDTLQAHGITGEVVVADNGSTDGSRDLALAAGARVVEVPVRGYGAALSGGFAAARGEICVMGDADATYPFELISLLVEPIARGEADMTIGSRLSGATARTMPFLHRFVGTPVITWLVRRAGGPANLHDSQSGFRAFRREALLDLRLRGTGMEYASEMLIVAGRAGWRVQEIETGYRERVGESKLNTLSDGLRHLTTILLLAPDLAATLPGGVVTIAGAIALAWALLDPSIMQAGSPAWLASFFGPALLVLGSQSIMVGLLLAAYSPLAPRSRRISPEALLSGYSLGGVWATCAGLTLLGALALVGLAGLHTPVRAPQIQMVAFVLILVGGSAIAASVVARLLVEGLRRYAPATSPPAGRGAAETDAGDETGVVAADSTASDTRGADGLSE